MLFDAILQKQAEGIPNFFKREWDHYTSGISPDEFEEIIAWINSKFDEVKKRRDKVQPSGWLGSGFEWLDCALGPIYRECKAKMPKQDSEVVQEKSGQIFGLFVSVTLSDFRDDETWYFVKGEDYRAHGVPIRSRIYFLPDY